MQVTDWLSAVLVGALIGALGRLVIPGRQRIGMFVTLLIGVGAAMLGSVVAGAFGVHDNAPAKVGSVQWDWIELSIQVGFAVVGTVLAAWIATTRISHNDTPARRKPRKARTSRS